ncbi:peptidoglycan-binding domain-containing protein [Vulcaniibacterium gelatinicum]|uniref:peptidoglycan-binding domain-containing protein n=1 Tax=Vulcaniibacterium gelatinicum TaxID=2598725 RepID=UPI0011CBAB30|nr:peptidoglycan-binding domain-containing protein [Vulcaniibacterium gelatinicum]
MGQLMGRFEPYAVEARTRLQAGDLQRQAFRAHGHGEDVQDQAVSLARRGIGTEPLRAGVQGEEVRALQAALSRLGYRDQAGRQLTADGDFGRLTRQAVLAFQRAHGLTADGIAGPQTQAALRRAVESPTPVDPVHPQHALYRQVRAGVEALDQALGRAADAASLRLAARLTWLAREQGLTRVDRVVLSEDPVRGVRGERVFVWQGRPGEAGQRWAGIETHTALATPVEASFQGLAAFERGLAPAWAREQAEATLRHTAYRDGLRPGIAP